MSRTEASPDSSVNILCETIVGVLADPYFSIPSKEANLCLQAARTMVHCFSEPNELHQEFSSWLIASLTAVVESAKGLQHINKEKLWIQFHELTSSQDFISKWEGFANNLSVTVPPLLYQHITDEIFKDIIKKSFGSLVSEATTEEDAITLSNEEENAIHYVGGYVIQQLKKINLIPVCFHYLKN